MTYQEFLDGLSKLFGFTVTTFSFIFITIFFVVIIILIIVNLRMFLKRKSVKMFILNFKNKFKQKKIDNEAKSSPVSIPINNEQKQAPTIGNIVENVVAEHIQNVIIPYMVRQFRELELKNELNVSKPKYNQQSVNREEIAKNNSEENFFTQPRNFEIQNQNQELQSTKREYNISQNIQQTNTDIEVEELPLYQKSPTLQPIQEEVIEEEYADGGFPLKEKLQKEKGEYDDLKW